MKEKYEKPEVKDEATFEPRSGAQAALPVISYQGKSTPGCSYGNGESATLPYTGADGPIIKK